MNNIFENAYFGKVYKTRDGRKAIYWQPEPNHVEWHKLIVANDSLDIICYDDGFTLGLRNNRKEDPSDIVSEWEEPINEEELDKLADAETFKKSKEFDNYLDAILSLLDGENQLKIIFKKCLIWAFKVGYRKAKEV